MFVNFKKLRGFQVLLVAANPTRSSTGGRSRLSARHPRSLKPRDSQKSVLMPPGARHTPLLVQVRYIPATDQTQSIATSA